MKKQCKGVSSDWYPFEILKVFFLKLLGINNQWTPTDFLEEA